MANADLKFGLIDKRRVLRQQKGIGMVEVLITLFVLSIGLLGVASLQFVGSLSNKDALSRSQAVMVAQQMSERLRASVVPSRFSDGFVVSNEYFDASNYNFANSSCTGNPYDCNCLALPSTVPDCQSNICTADQIAQFDAHQMSCAAVETNPNATLEVSCIDNNLADGDACTAGSIHTITVKWPAAGWQDASRVANADCNARGNSDFDCVIIRLAL